MREARAEIRCHHAQMAVTRMNALTTAGWGLTSAEHYYGLPEALFEDRGVQNFPLDYDYNDEYFRFSVSARCFARAPSRARRNGTRPWSGSWSWLHLRADLHDLRRQRDLMRARQADWHKEYTWKSMWDYFTPRAAATARTGIAGRPRTRSSGRRTTALDGLHQRVQERGGGRVCAGSDSGFIYRSSASAISANWNCCRRPASTRWRWCAPRPRRERPCAGSRTRSAPSRWQACRPAGSRPQPAHRLQAARHRGLRLDEATNGATWHRGLKYTIKDGVIYDTAELLADVRDLVKATWDEAVRPNTPRRIRRRRDRHPRCRGADRLSRFRQDNLLRDYLTVPRPPTPRSSSTRPARSASTG